ncbi:MAG TPA: bifunctional phosphopantothenoylcysteine decarboxylase/phosphopantothenate--cysteine ligase CoaBC [Tahibacter sp.]|uniref:bifunctional phosphopantothenoylcysteine decarboxylase/phosphopantothenate--cysteine ligase CoaBC n=1 Tax=Tahibacter sp. TaxID=2056211 RepID=UPI002B92F8EE|nr:bifunctional phosphopantothenoylcysteine decarboxylase/phosphopantothenate--cysteine ligase CoaBC [Tahibacter sp.]HSX61054.1 bifunctional phosphopantothenoylcysteine decarboxylase/phosphopantothenate--cysteine ligase CoaBC [Tahibacter sp.]
MASTGLAGRRVLLGVTGGIAAYKAAELVRRLGDAGAQVRVAMTENAARFVTPLTFQALSGNPVRLSLWDEHAEAAMGHIELARWAEDILIAPASADFLARLAHGLADDLLTTLCLASAAPVHVAPAMNQQMWANAATQANLALLRSRGVGVFGPAAGSQACGEVGSGRLLEPNELVEALANTHRPQTLAGRRVLISAGPTYEDIDPVRFLGNRSSGRMGFAIAAAAVEAGADVTLVAGPVHLPTPAGAQRIDVRSAREMHAAVMRAAESADVYVAAAAVGDFRPQEIAAHKIKKRGDGGMTLELTQNPDILADLAALPRRPLLVGFAAETEHVEAHARAKLERKGLDLVAANQVGGGLGFEADDNCLTLIDHDGTTHLPTASKRELARQLVDIVAQRLERRETGAARR